MTESAASPPTRLQLRHPRGVCHLTVGVDSLAAEQTAIDDWIKGRRVFLVTSPRVADLYASEVLERLGAATRVTTLSVPEGEEAKSLSVAGDLWKRLLEAGGKRDSRLVTLGGGSVGDLGGFVAGCFLRGIEYIQLPTTLLAQVDASIGGKTAIDLPEAKNSVGLFHHPSRVLIDTRWLGSLPRSEVRSGLFEVIKMAFLLDPELLERVEKGLERLLAGEAEAWVPVVSAAAAAKVGVVERDPEEADERRLLNFGHTLAHALETALGYSNLRHGEAVGWGLRLALRLSVSRELEEGEAQRLERLIERIGLPVLPRLPALEVDNLMDLMRRDKKAREGGISWVLASSIGRGAIVSGIEDEEVRSELASLMARAHSERIY